MGSSRYRYGYNVHRYCVTVVQERYMSIPNTIASVTRWVTGNGWYMRRPTTDNPHLEHIACMHIIALEST